MRVSTSVNGEARVADGVWEGESLLYLLRERFGLYGSKNACEQGECGSCSVYLDGTLVCACLVLGGQANGRSLVTIEGLDGEKVEQAFVEAGAVQCGFCTPGFLMSAKAFLDRNPRPNEQELRLALAGNLCRCTGYDKIMRAILSVVGEAPIAAS